MLGCHDFCGYYDWTFHYLRRRFGEAALKKYWSDAIADDSQLHYVEAGLERGLRGLYDCWKTTGEDEQCDWTVTLDEAGNSLRLDMKECPSKGFLLDHDLNADEDYCNHCIGWIGSALSKVGAEVVAHEHNHCGQCWWQMSMKDRPSQPRSDQADIRQDERWGHGYLHRFDHQLPVVEASQNSYPDSVRVIQDAFVGVEEVLVLGDHFDAAQHKSALSSTAPSIVTDYAYRQVVACGHHPRVVIVGHEDRNLQQFATAWTAVSSGDQPLLLHPYLPGLPPTPFVQLGLPRPLPLLPIVIRENLYVHQPGGPFPTTNEWAVMLGQAVQKKQRLMGIN